MIKCTHVGVVTQYKILIMQLFVFLIASKLLRTFVQQHIHIGDEAFFAEDDEEEEEEANEASSITQENLRTNKFLSQEEKTPKFIIIGATKCSTSALLRAVLVTFCMYLTE